MWFLCVWLDQPCVWQRSSLSGTHTVYRCYILVKHVRRIELLASLACYESCERYFYEVIVVLQGSSAFVYGWVAFCDRLSNGVTVKIIQQFAPQSTTEWELFETVTSTPTANNMAVCSSGRVNGPLRCLYFVTRTKSPVLVLYTKPLVRV